MHAGTPDLDDLLRHADWVRRLALQLCADVHAAEDAVQDTWTAALRRPPRHGENLRGFFPRLLRNALGQRRRGDGRRAARERQAGGDADRFAEAAADSVARAELHRELVRLVLRLPEPQQALLLLHYFDGVEVAALAQRFALTADAVRAHLHRGRQRLRAQLERSDARARLGFALLLANSPSVVPTTTLPLSTTAAAAVATAITISIKTKLAITGAAATAALLLWTGLQPGDLPPPSAHPIATLQAEPVAAGGTVPTDGPGPDASSATREQVAGPGDRLLTCQLVGLQPGVPWDDYLGGLRVHLEGKDEAADVWRKSEQQPRPDADGRFTVALPPWVSSCTSFAALFSGRSTNYEMQTITWLAPTGREIGRVDGSTLELPVQLLVQPSVWVDGRVVLANGQEAAAAAIRVYSIQGGLPAAPVGKAVTADDGGFALHASVTGEVLVVAQAMVPSPGRISNHPRLDLQPACLRTTLRVGVATTLPTLVLGDPAWVEGRLLRPDDSPARGIGLQLRYDCDAVVDGVAFWRDGSCALQAFDDQDPQGRFRLAGDRRHPATLAVVGGPGVEDQPSIERKVMAPAWVELRLPGRMLRIVTRTDGVAAPVSFLAGSEKQGAGLRSNANGELDVLLPPGQTWHLHTNERGCTVQQFTIAPDQPVSEPLRIDLRRLLLVPVLVTCRSEIAVENAELQWTPSASSGLGGAAMTARWPSAREPFACELPAGSYRLRLTPSYEARANDEYVMPAERDVLVGDLGADVAIAVAHGGKISIQALDRRRQRMPGSAVLFQASGRSSTPPFRRGRERAEPAGGLLLDRPSVTFDNLEPGRYEVVVDLGPHGTHRRPLEVRARETTPIRIDVP